jgi:uncharacterized membrane protein
METSMASSILNSTLNRDLPLVDNSYPIPAEGQPYVPLPDRERDGRTTASAVQTILADPLALYTLWRDLAWIPRWQEYVLAVTPMPNGITHWIMGNPDDPLTQRFEFDAQIVEDIQGERISWRSLTPEIEQTGMVTFIPTASGRGTRVTLTQTVRSSIAGLSNNVVGIGKRSPKRLVTENLRHFKQLAETGEIPSVKDQPHGPRGTIGGIKEWIYGEHNPTPIGTSDAA